MYICCQCRVFAQMAGVLGKDSPPGLIPSPCLPAAVLTVLGQPCNSSINVQSFPSKVLNEVSETLPALEKLCRSKGDTLFSIFIRSLTPFSITALPSGKFRKCLFFPCFFHCQSITVMYDLSRVIMSHWISLSTHPFIH